MTTFLLPRGWLVYVFAAVYLCSSWLIEWRYALVPLAIWMALRQGASARQEMVSLVAWIVLGQFIVWGIFGGHFML